jgi:prepilin-type N-terminal cleavage/methylation domain-containing protein
MKECFKKYRNFLIRMPGWTSLLKGQQGFSLPETLAAIVLLGILSSGFLVGLQTSTKALILADEHHMAKTLAVYQMENVMNHSYSTSYTPSPIPSEYPNYSVDISTDFIPSKGTNIQEIKITISHQGKPIILSDNCTLMDWKVN